jgi:hypothetical protein
MDARVSYLPASFLFLKTNSPRRAAASGRADGPAA